MVYMSFAKTIPQMLDESKTVTRRLGWHTLTPGTLLQPVEKRRGLKKGQKVVTVGRPIQVESVRRERLSDITWTETQLEGFPKMSPREFVAMFTKMNSCRDDAVVSRIQFRFVTL